MMAYAWPGNVRELQNICERAAVLTDQPEIPAALLAPWLTGQLAPATPEQPAGAPTTNSHGKPASMIEVAPIPGAPTHFCPEIVCDGDLTLDEVERQTIVATLKHNNGHRQRSAKALGIGVRTLGLKLKKWKDQRIVSPTL